MANPEYTRLTWARRRRKGFVTVLPGARANLWLGGDHLLQVSATFGSEEYKRFFFRDIQAITILETRRRRNLNIVLVSLMILAFSVEALSRLWLGIPGWALTVIAFVLFGALLLINNLLGPTCNVQLRTAVQIEDLPSLSRVRRTRRVLDRIRPFIAAAQGQLTPADTSAHPQEAVDAP